MTKAQTSADPQHALSAPWWSFAHVWMVIAGPAVVVVAGFYTLFLAIRTPDPVLNDDSAQAAVPFRYAPAAAARNHAATGAVPESPPVAGAAAKASGGGSPP
jgi:uncharacterized protein